MDLETPYKPTLIYYPDADVLEFVERDVATVSEEVIGGLALVRDMTTREIVGYRIDGVKHAFSTPVHTSPAFLLLGARPPRTESPNPIQG